MSLERTARQTHSVTDRKTYKCHIFTPTPGAQCSSPPKYAVVEDVVPILKGGHHFSIQYTGFPTGCKMLIFDQWVKTIPAVCHLIRHRKQNTIKVTLHQQHERFLQQRTYILNDGHSEVLHVLNNDLLFLWNLRMLNQLCQVLFSDTLNTQMSSHRFISYHC